MGLQKTRIRSAAMKNVLLYVWAVLGILSLPIMNAQISSDVKIGTQVWMSKNLDISTYRNGDPIRYASSASEWLDASNKEEGAWCYYNNDPKNGKKYGKLYNWYAVNDSRGLAPIGYHVPSDDEWITLVDFLGGENIACKRMKSKKGWIRGGNGDNRSGFNGLPGGGCYYNGIFDSIGEDSEWWSSSEFYEASDGRNAWKRSLNYDNSQVQRYPNYLYYGFSVRCLKD
jgi:uncharacterized protein (TIGR02145 family)